jgi:sugar O-acyltransferase (sialic acid O-acetyltransferase NeuD family)
MSAMPGRLLVLGAGGHGRALADLASACGWTVAGFTDPAGAAAGEGVLGTDAAVEALLREHRLDGALVGVGNTALARRAELYELLCRLGAARPALVHPRATVSPAATLAPGAAVFAGCVLGTGVRVGENAVLYSGAIAEHGCRIGDHAYLSPGVVLSGDVAIERGAFLGAGAVVVPGVTIGVGAVVGAGAVVTGDVAAGLRVAGVPARALVTS